jgi:acylphosphatase
MKKCLKIAFGTPSPGSLISEIQKKGTKLGIEGTIQFVPADKELRIIACGLKEQVDQFVDLVHKDAAQAGINDINIEPFVKAKDYRGAFRIIE